MKKIVLDLSLTLLLILYRSTLSSSWISVLTTSDQLALAFTKDKQVLF